MDTDLVIQAQRGDEEAFATLRTFLELRVFYFRQLVMEADPTLSYPGPWRGHGVLGKSQAK